MKPETQKLREESRKATAKADVMRMLTTSDELLKRDPSDAEAMFVAGTAFLQAGQEGIACLVLNAARCAATEKVALGATWNNIGCALQEYQPEEAYRAFLKAIEYGHNEEHIYDNLCNVASQIGRHAEALEFAAKGRDALTAYNRSFALMHLGRWGEAWAAYAKSVGRSCRPLTERNYDLPRWDGKKPGKVIIHGEQGVGDEIMFMSMCPKDFDGVIECNPRTETLFARSFPRARVYGTLLEGYLEWPLHERADYHIEMGGLGEVYAPEPFRRGPFLMADQSRYHGWYAWLGCEDGGHSASIRAGLKERKKRVGIAWTGGAWSTGRAKRSVPFELIARLIDANPDVTFVCLEYEDRREELAAYPQVLNPHWATKKGADLDDLAALVSSLDLVISATNSTVDVAGALGVPCWALVPHNPPWRYSDAAGADKMWFYESVRCFRQQARDNGRWERVVGQVGVALEEIEVAKVAAE